MHTLQPWSNLPTRKFRMRPNASSVPPQPHSLIVSPTPQHRRVRAEGNLIHGPDVAPQRRDEGAVLRVPQLDVVVPGRGGDVKRVGGKRYHVHLLLVP